MSNPIIVIDSDSDSEVSKPKKAKLVIKPSCSKSSNGNIFNSRPGPSGISKAIKPSTSKSITSSNPIFYDINKNDYSPINKHKLSNNVEIINDKIQRKRIKPQTVLNSIDKEKWYQSESPVIPLDEVYDDDDDDNIDDDPLAILGETTVYHTQNLQKNEANKNEQNFNEISDCSMTVSDSDIVSTEIDERKTSDEFQTFLKACREADKSKDMEKLINKKLLKYYFSVHPDFVASKSFLKSVTKITNEVKDNPDHVYMKIKIIFEELKIRRKTNTGVMSNEASVTTGNVRKDDQVYQLNVNLSRLKKVIAYLEQQECDLNDDNSSYIKLEKCKKRACQIYEKICDLTGESKHAHRSVQKPIKFNETNYSTFNKMLQDFVNRNKIFPDYQDVLRVLQHCNTHYDYGLKSFEMETIAMKAFEAIGKMLQKRRKGDLYETVVYFATEKDPALEDQELNEKLLENKKKFHPRMGMLIDEFVEKQFTTPLQDEGISTIEKKKRNRNSESTNETGQTKENGTTDNIINDSNENSLNHKINSNLNHNSSIKVNILNDTKLPESLLKHTKPSNENKLREILTTPKSIPDVIDIDSITNINKQTNNGSIRNNSKNLSKVVEIVISDEEDT